jgi:hypothetical protein
MLGERREDDDEEEEEEEEEGVVEVESEGVESARLEVEEEWGRLVPLPASSSMAQPGIEADLLGLLLPSLPPSIGDTDLISISSLYLLLSV